MWKGWDLYLVGWLVFGFFSFILFHFILSYFISFYFIIYSVLFFFIFFILSYFTLICFVSRFSCRFPLGQGPDLSLNSLESEYHLLYEAVSAKNHAKIFSHLHRRGKVKLFHLDKHC